ncbi:iron chelate uptake ABC transporter family permease subunit [Bacillus licheniformis]|uniref:Iron chelate uptake ABC transporter family permease subunit n=1 Tax=Bacillus licheniformis TaxID=1402 RepID=A0AB37GUU9_BACLI|nr:hypothetical protein BSZ43_13835 [Bacillus sp. H15-1]ASV17722.1 hypothetical protein CJO35_13940 [Bacillus sp. 1s-1]ATI78474.1 hypothetical protein CPQ91_14060 [Bacillus licheniformis]MBC9088277.1 iron chelate uptake ABC transporter family permease subunit [Bacillus sp. Y1]MBJ7888955.1 iron chelate uptake ABC transporter family permease subunit [Bacillaceae bacterium HSR45]MBY8347319.1 hypothetical protein [Bacillus sp. PCH94]NBB44449.1 iron chelate uptake ABC transporter family permease s
MEAGTESAVLLGLSLKKTNALLFFISALLTAGAVSIVGAIGFIGLIGPHIAKLDRWRGCEKKSYHFQIY